MIGGERTCHSRAGPPSVRWPVVEIASYNSKEGMHEDA